MTLPKSLVCWKIRFGLWRINRKEKKFLNDHLVKHDGHINKTALHHLCIAVKTHKLHDDVTPTTFTLVDSKVDLFSMVLSHHYMDADVKIYIHTRMHKAMSNAPSPTIEVKVEKFDPWLKNKKRKRISEVEYEFMNSISTTTILNPSGNTKTSEDEIEALISTLRAMFDWVINQYIDWRS